MSDRQSTRHFRVAGMVQGVGFRAFVVREAAKLALSGWARNRRDGTVEVVATGPEEAVAALVAACRQGPRMARVDRIDDLEPAAAATGPFTIVDDR